MYEEYAKEIAALKLQNSWSWLLGINVWLMLLLYVAFIVVFLLVACRLEKVSKKQLASFVRVLAIVFGISFGVWLSISAPYKEEVTDIKDKYFGLAKVVPKCQKVSLYPLDTKITKGFSKNDLKSYIFSGIENKYTYITKGWLDYHKNTLTDSFETSVKIFESKKIKESYLKIVRYEYKDKRFNKVLKKRRSKDYYFFVKNFDKDVFDFSGERQYYIMTKEKDGTIYYEVPVPKELTSFLKPLEHEEEIS